MSPEPLADIRGEQDIAALVKEFYGRAFEDPLLRPLFVEVAGMDLDAHLPVMQDFWMTVLFRAGRYHRNALEPHVALHAKAPLTEAHFSRWLQLWSGTVAERHEGPIADHARLQAQRIAGSLRRRLEEPSQDSRPGAGSAAYAGGPTVALGETRLAT